MNTFKDTLEDYHSYDTDTEAIAKKKDLCISLPWQVLYSHPACPLPSRGTYDHVGGRDD